MHKRIFGITNVIIEDICRELHRTIAWP